MIPPHIASQLQEHSSMGFMLFYTDEEGAPSHHFDFDCETAYYGLSNYAAVLLESLKNLDRNKFQEFISQQIEESGDGSDFSSP